MRRAQHPRERARSCASATTSHPGIVLPFLLAILCSGCVQTRNQTDATGSIYGESIQPILDSKCTACHGSGRAERGLRVDSWSRLIRGSDFGEALISFNAEHSLLVELATGYTAGSHPEELGSERLTSGELERIRDWIDRGASGPNDQVPFSESNALVYVANQGESTVSVINTESNTVVRRVDLTSFGFDATAKPHHIAVEDDGSYWYVTLIGGNEVLKFNRRNELVGRSAFEVPGLLALDSKNRRLYVGRSMAAVNPPTRIGIIDTESMEIEEVDVFHQRPHALAVDPTGRFVLSGSLGENQIAVIDPLSGDLTRHTVDGPIHTLVQFAISPDGATMIVGGQLTGRLFFYDVTHLPALSLKKVIDVNPGPWHPIFSVDGSRAFIANKMANTVTVLNMHKMDVEAVISGEGLSQPHGSALSHDGRYLYISNNNLDGSYTPRYDLGEKTPVGTVAIIDTETLHIIKVLDVGSYASGMGARIAR